MIPLTRPTLPKLDSIRDKLRDIFNSGMLTNYKYVKEFEKKCANFLGVTDTVAVSSGTSALVLILKCLDLKGEVILPSFTFTSGAHSLLWCGLKPVFADINPKTLNIDPDSIEKKITSRTSAIMPTHVFGNPCEIDRIQKIAQSHNLKVIYDAAHAFGSRYKDKSIACFGTASIFSFTPTKVLTTTEGGLIVINNKRLAKILRLGRNNGDSFNRREEFLGITARMSEINAVMGIEGFKILNKNLKRRIKKVRLYQQELAKLGGITFQQIHSNDFSVYKDLIILIDRNKFGMNRDELLQQLLKYDIQTKIYFAPPLHKKKVYSKYRNLSLPHTDFASNHILNLPLYSHMPEKYVIKVCSIIKKLYRNKTRK